MTLTPDLYNINTSALLLDRGKTHGAFEVGAAQAQRLKTVMSNGQNWKRLSDGQKQALEMISYKIARILTGDPDYRDHWIDIGGYAKLVADELGAVACESQTPGALETPTQHWQGQIVP
jgi:hypothetical protein